VDGQHRPDPAFPTVSFPNPEEPGALDAGLTLAASVRADVLLAHDPDADRLGVAVPHPAAAGAGRSPAMSGWRVLNGNEIGVLLADHLLRHRRAAGERLVVTTVVSSRLLSRLAAFHGVHYAETLTGFKWVVRPALAHPEWDFVLGYEEALGFSVGGPVRDKDGIAAAVVFAELVAQLHREGRTVPGRLEELARRFGLHATLGFSLRFAEVATAAAVMDRLRATPPGSVGDHAVTETEDLALRPAPGATDALRWELADGSRVLLRPSGTEPKLKVYLERVDPVPGHRAFAAVSAEAAERLAGLRSAVEASVALPG
jgi:phosphomannomutase